MRGNQFNFPGMLGIVAVVVAATGIFSNEPVLFVGSAASGILAMIGALVVWPLWLELAFGVGAILLALLAPFSTCMLLSAFFVAGVSSGHVYRATAKVHDRTYDVPRK